MTLEEFNSKIAQLKAEGSELAKAGKLEEAEAKKAEIEKMSAEFQAAKEQQAEENALVDNTTIPAPMQAEQKLGEENEEMEKIYDASSVEYKNAFLKHLTGRDDQMTKMENTAFIHTTSNTDAVLPTTMIDKIWDLVSKTHVIMGDIQIYKTGTILEIVKHTAIAAGAAEKQARKGSGSGTDKEGKAPTNDEQNTFVKVTLAGNDFVKAVEISYAEAAMSLDAFEQYLINEIATNIGEALADDAVASIEDGIASDNKIQSAGVKVLAFADVAEAFGNLERVSDPVVYCTRKTLYNRLVTLQNAAGQLIYQPSAVAGVPGTLLGAQVKIEDSVADDVLLIGDPKKFVYNMIQDVMVETDKDIKAHKYIYSGYARGEGSLVDDKAFVQLTVKQA